MFSAFYLLTCSLSRFFDIRFSFFSIPSGLLFSASFWNTILLRGTSNLFKFSGMASKLLSGYFCCIFVGLILLFNRLKFSRIPVISKSSEVELDSDGVTLLFNL
jgi:hypothetical protein